MKILEQGIPLGGIEVNCPNCYSTLAITADDVRINVSTEKSFVICENCQRSFEITDEQSNRLGIHDF